MKKIIITAILAITSILPAAAQLQDRPRDFLVLVDQFDEQSRREEAFKSLLAILLDEIRPGESMTIRDGNSFREIAAFKLPPGAAYANTRLKVRQCADGIAALKGRLLGAGAAAGENTFFRAPQFLRQLSAEPRAADRTLVILLVGCPLYNDPREPDFSMVGKFPTDGHLTAPFEATPYSTLNSGSLHEASVVWCDFGVSKYLNEVHQARVQRFWRLFGERLGARTVLFAADLVPAIKKIGIDERQNNTEPADQLDEKEPPRMVIPAARSVDVGWLINPEPKLQTPVEAPVSTPISTISEPMPTKIGITWNDAEHVDLDLYITVGNGPEISYLNPETQSGTLLKDYGTLTPKPLNGFEAVELTGNPGLETLEVWVNLYRLVDHQGPVTGEIRMLHNGRIRKASVAFSSKEGSRGVDRNRRGDSPYWQRVDLAKLAASAK